MGLSGTSRGRRGTFFWALWLLLAFANALIGAHAQSVCAEVKIEIKQEASFERQAFEALLKVNNGLDSSAVQNIDVDVSFFDELGNSVIASSDPNNSQALFFIRLDSLDGITAVDGTGSVAPSSTGTVRWIIIPAAGAAGTLAQGKRYQVGATINFSIAGETRTVEVTPDRILVKPQPRFTLDYFLSRDVYADDPFTVAVEPVEPFTLGVRVKNTGAGAANEFQIKSAQPRIVENVQGLLVNFRIIGSFVDNTTFENSLNIKFGQIAAHSSRIGRWILTSDLPGRFVDFTADYSHSDELGGALTSLLDAVNTHTLLRDVLVVLNGRDQVRDFLALDGDVVRVYESSGADSEAVDQSVNATLTPIAAGYRLDFPTVPGLVYVSRPDPRGGLQAPSRVTRSDGRELRPENFWVAKRRNPDGVSVAYSLNVFDAVAGTGPFSYTIAYNGAPPTAVSGQVYDDRDNDGLKDADEPGLADVAVQLDLEGNTVAGPTLQSDAQGNFSFSGLDAGRYRLTVGALSGFNDGSHAVGNAGGTAFARGIANINLLAGVPATGYLLAKRSLPALGRDLSIALSAASTTPTVGSDVLFTATLRNEGTQAISSITVNNPMPLGLSYVSATPAVGSYDAATHRWRLTSLAPGASSTLQFVVRPTVTTAITKQVNVNVSGDQIAANNVASVVLNPLPSAQPLIVSQSIEPETRLLVWTACDSNVTNPAACAQSRAQRADLWLSDRGISHVSTFEAAQFRAELRSGRWNTVWISGGTAALGEALQKEVREAVFGGSGLLLDDVRDSSRELLEAVAGVSYSRELPASSSGLSAAGLRFAELPQRIDGSRRLYLSAGATVEAWFGPQEGSAAILSQAYGAGRSVVLGFALLDSASGAGRDPALAALLDSSLLSVLPAVPKEWVSGDYAAVTTRVRNTSDVAQDVEVASAVSGGARIVHTLPGATLQGESAAAWQLPVALEREQLFDIGLRTPATGSSTQVSSVVSRKLAGQYSAVGEYSLGLSLRTRTELLSGLDNALRSLPTDLFGTRGVIEGLLAQLEQVRQLLARGEFESALTTLTTLAGQLPGSQTSVLETRHLLGLLLREISQSWYRQLPGCSTGANGPVAASGAGYAEFGTHNLLATAPAGGWLTGLDYRWRLQFAADGSGEFVLSANGAEVLRRNLRGSTESIAGLRNMLRFAVAGGSSRSTLTVWVDALAGVAGGQRLSTEAAASSRLWYWAPALGAQAQVEGRLQFSGSAGGRDEPWQLDFGLGHSSCGQAQR